LCSNYWNQHLSEINLKTFTRFEWNFINKKSEIVPVDVTMIQLEIDDNFHLFLICRDISFQKAFENEKKIIQKNLLEQSKLVTLGEISTGIAHEINQPLTFISSMVQNIMIDIDSPGFTIEEISNLISPIQSEIDKIDRIISHLRNYSRADMEDFLITDLKPIISNTLLFYREGMRTRGVNFIFNFPENSPRINAIPSQIQWKLLIMSLKIKKLKFQENV